MDKLHPDYLPLSRKTALPLAEKSAVSLTKSPAHNKKKEIEAAEKFETMMAQQMVHSMQTSLEKGSLFGEGVQGSIYSGLTEWDLAKVLSKNAHFGIKEQILRHLPKEEDVKP